MVPFDILHKRLLSKYLQHVTQGVDKSSFSESLLPPRHHLRPDWRKTDISKASFFSLRSTITSSAPTQWKIKVLRG